MKIILVAALSSLLSIFAGVGSVHAVHGAIAAHNAALAEAASE